MGCRDLIRSQLWYNSVCDDQIEIWWVVETGSEVNYGIIAWALTKTRSDGRQQYTFEGRIQWKKYWKKNWIKSDKLTDNDRAFRHWPLLCKRSGSMQWETRQTFNNWHIMYAMIHPSLYINTDCNGMRHFSKTMVCANAGYLLSHPSTGVRRADYFYSSTEKSSAQRFEIKTKNMGTTPHKALGVGSLTTIHRASKCLPQVVWYLQCIQKTNMNAWIRKKPKGCN